MRFLCHCFTSTTRVLGAASIHWPNVLTLLQLNSVRDDFFRTQETFDEAHAKRHIVQTESAFELFISVGAGDLSERYFLISIESHLASLNIKP